jgi:phosphatidylglycerol:prolipoprotein diacylglycerol transferase
MFWAMVAVVVGARLGDVIFYNHDYYLQHPLEILATWKGGMSFHGGLIGVVIVSLLYVRYHKIGFIRFMDIAAVNAPIALMFGRLANFINGELYGRVTEVAWAMPFPKGGGLPRHPSQLYEALFEGLVLYVVLRLLYKHLYKRPGIIGGLFMVGYGVARFFIEYYREPEALSWIENSYFSGGQILCLLMVIVGLFWIIWFVSRPKIETHPQ